MGKEWVVCGLGLTLAVTKYETYASFVSANSLTGSLTCVMRYPYHFGSCGPRFSSPSSMLCLKPGRGGKGLSAAAFAWSAGDSQVTLSKTSSISSPSMLTAFEYSAAAADGTQLTSRSRIWKAQQTRTLLCSTPARSAQSRFLPFSPPS